MTFLAKGCGARIREEKLLDILVFGNTENVQGKGIELWKKHGWWQQPLDVFLSLPQHAPSLTENNERSPMHIPFSLEFCSLLRAPNLTLMSW